jgi:ribose transport system ATP-binding protein
MRDLVQASGLIILDESTRSLARNDMQQFHRMLRRVVNEGTSVLLVSHNLAEVLAVSEQVTVLRDGYVAGAGLATKALTEQQIAKLMLGQDVGTLVQRPLVERPTAAITVTGLSGPNADGLDFEIGAGEVVGLTGLPGSGFESLPYLLAGAIPATGGRLRTPKGDLDMAKVGVRRCMRAGIALVPERRDRDGLAMNLSVRDNVSLPTLRANGSRWFVGRKWQHETTTKAIDTLGIRPNAPMRLVSELSGGNQQKVLLAKWMSLGPRLLILHEPAQAVDVGARQDLLTAIHRAADNGVAVLLVSVEASDLAAACDRILVYHGPDRLQEIRTTDPDTVLDTVYTELPSAS